MSSVQIDFAKSFLFLFDGNVGFNDGTMGADFVGELVAVFSSSKSQGNILLQVIVGDLVPLLLFLAMLINQLGNGRTMSGLLGLDLHVKAVNDGLKFLLVLTVVIQIAVNMSMKPTETNAGILEFAHGAGVGVDVTATFSPWSAVLQACDRFRSRMGNTAH